MKFHDTASAASLPASVMSRLRPLAVSVFAIVLVLFACGLQTACVAEAEAGDATPPPRSLVRRPAAAPAKPAPPLVASRRPLQTPLPKELPPVDLGPTFAKWGFAAIPQPTTDTAAWKNPALNLRVEVHRDKSYILFNGSRVWLGSPVSGVGRRWRIARADFDNALLPVLAPTATLLNSGIPLRRPAHVFLDPGHGGSDVGCENKALGLREKTLTLDVAYRVKHLLERRGFRVTLSRTRDIEVGLADRPAAAQRVGADLFVSIHFNSAGAGGPRITGIETFALPPRGQFSTHSRRDAGDRAILATQYPGHAFTPYNTILAYKIQTALAHAAGATGVANRGVKRARLAVLKPALMPAVLVECGFVPSDIEGPKIASAAHRERLARGIADGISAYQTTIAAAAAKRGGDPKVRR